MLQIKSFEFTYDESEEPNKVTDQINEMLSKIRVSAEDVVSVVQKEGTTRVFYKYIYRSNRRD